MKIENKYSKTALKNIDIILKTRGIPIGTFEREIGVTVGYFSRFKKKEGFPSFEVIMRACKYLGVSVDDLTNDDLIGDLINEIQEYKNKISDCETRIRERLGGRK